MQRYLGCICTLAVLIIACHEAAAMWMQPNEQVPVDRLVANLKAYLKEHPEDADAYAELARVYNLLYASEANEVPVYNHPEKYPEVAWQEAEPPPIDWRVPGHITPDQQRYFFESIRMYLESVKRKPDNIIAWMGLGYMYYRGSKEVPALSWPFPNEPFDKEAIQALRRAWQDKSLDAYHKAKGLCSNQESFTMGETRAEAVGYILKILGEREAITESEKAEQKELKKELSRIPRTRMVTPIIFSLEGPAQLRLLLKPGGMVKFDLDGRGSNHSWPWVSPRTCLLAWDPDGTGKITSGRQLFGSASWWMFWKDGYRALNVLDDNRDGWLSNSELAGLAVWRDANGNGASDTGEVIPVSAAGIEALAVAATGVSEGMPCNTQGLRLKSGQVLPTYDWVTQPVD